MAGYNSSFTGPQIDDALSRAAPGGAIDASIQAKPNPNLLDNWYFGNPVNQRGQTEYSNANSYCIDRWFAGGDTVNLESDGLLITAPYPGIIFRQVIENPERLSGKTVTLSIDANVISGNWYLTDVGNFSAQHADYHINNGVTSLTFPVNSPSNLGNYTCIGFWGDIENAQIKIRSIKLELGNQQTLAHQDANGNWVLNEIPDYGEQLARCQRYLPVAVLTGDSEYQSVGVGAAVDSTTVKIQIPTPVSCRTTPILLLSGMSNLLLRGGRFLTPNAVSVDIYSKTAITLSCTVSSAIVGEAYELIATPAVNLLLSADL